MRRPAATGRISHNCSSSSDPSTSLYKELRVSSCLHIYYEIRLPLIQFNAAGAAKHQSSAVSSFKVFVADTKLASYETLVRRGNHLPVSTDQSLTLVAGIDFT